TILTLTDFTENASHAAASALMLAEKLHSRLLLYNTFYNMPILPSYAGEPWVEDDLASREEESNKNLRQLADIFAERIAKTSFEVYKPAISYQYGEGELLKNVEAIINDNDIELIVMGARTGTTLGHILNGSDTRSVIDHVSRPVLVIPEMAKFDAVGKVTLATNYAASDLRAVVYLLKLSRYFNFQLEIVHVSLFWTAEEDNTEQKKYFREQVGLMNFPHVSYKEVKGRDVVGRLNRLCAEHESDILVLAHYKNGFFARLFSESTANKALSDQHLPLLIIPPKME